HAPVVTLGRGAKPEHLLAPAPALAERGIEVVSTDRGGDVTLHAPGQLVCYPIVRLPEGQRDVRRYVRGLAAVMNAVIAAHGIEGGLLDAFVGLWVDRASPGAWPGAEHAAEPAKIGAIGVKLSRWVTLHGFALNLSVDLSLFDWIVPCGIRE